MEHRKSLEITAPSAQPAPVPARPSQALRQTTGARRTAMRIMQRKSTGITAVYEQDPLATQAGSVRAALRAAQSLSPEQPEPFLAKTRQPAARLG